MMAFAAGAAVPLVGLFLGSGWGDVAPVFALLAIAGAFQTLSYVGNWIYLARALTGQLFWYSLVSLTIKVVCVVVGSRWGIVGVAAGYAIAPAIAWPISLWWLSRLTPIPVRELTFGALRITACAVVAGLACLLAVSLVAALPLILQILIGAGVVAVVYLLAGVVLRPIRADLREVLLIGRKALAK
jgi:PST family polysaccharide transporter